MRQNDDLRPEIVGVSLILLVALFFIVVALIGTLPEVDAYTTALLSP